jgi:hypothetical protein
MWRHAAGSPEPPLSLHDVAFSGEGVAYPAHRHGAGEEALAGHLDDGARILADPVAVLGAPPEPAGPPLVGDDFETLRWFWLPDEVRDAVEHTSAEGAPSAPQW